MMKRFISFALILLLANQCFSWNALGHRLVGQIAYDNLTKQAKQRYNNYNHALDKVYKPQSFANSAAWLDGLRYSNKLWMKENHYIDLPFSFDGTALEPPSKHNAISAIEDAKAVLKSKFTNEFDKGFNLRIILHVVGDLHQPLHAANQFSRSNPRGDLGGNRFRLGKNPVANNLHAYWDRGGGYLTKKGYYSKKQLEKKAQRISQKWPCYPEAMVLDPSKWAEESQQIAISKSYQLKPLEKPTKKYQFMVKQTSEQRIALAGCRLASLLNRIDVQKR